MKKYNIGEIISKISEVTHCAFAVKGELKGAFITVDTENRDKLVTHYTSGHATYDFNFILNRGMTEEEAKQWVFMHELDINDDEYLEITQLMRNSLLTAYETFDEKTQKEITEGLEKLIEEKESGDVE